MFKKATVVKLPTNQKAKVDSIASGKHNELLILKENEATSFNENTYWKLQHLYFLSDDEIKEGDWYIGDGVIYNLVTKPNGTNPKKIIATTNDNLIINIGGDNFPKPSQSFIEKYVAEYNKGNVITNVLVEYEVNVDKMELYTHNTGHQLRVNSKDNTITIKKVKDSWTKEELVQILSQFGKGVVNKESHLPHMFELYAIDWIEQNL